MAGFQLSIELTDLLGVSRICNFLSPNDHTNVKLCYCLLRIISNYPPPQN